MKILEKFVANGVILESDRNKLRSGVLCHAKYPICNIDELNKNKRMYGRDIWDRVNKDSEIQEN